MKCEKSRWFQQTHQCLDKGIVLDTFPLISAALVNLLKAMLMLTHVLQCYYYTVYFANANTWNVLFIVPAVFGTVGKFSYHRLFVPP